MASVRKIQVGDQELNAVEVDFNIVREEWNEYALADGGRVRTKTIVSKILRVVDENGKPLSTPEGDPKVVVTSANQVSASD